jgi:hypothetical protein
MVEGRTPPGSTPAWPATEMILLGCEGGEGCDMGVGWFGGDDVRWVDFLDCAWLGHFGGLFLVVPL